MRYPIYKDSDREQTPIGFVELGDVGDVDINNKAIIPNLVVTSEEDETYIIEYFGLEDVEPKILS